MKVSRNTAEHYYWGNACSGWHLLKSETLSVIEELMPPGTSEKLHYHTTAQQLFYILQGKAAFELNGIVVEALAGESMHILPGTRHRISNISPEDLRFIVVSQPRSHGDRVDVTAEQQEIGTAD